VKAAKGAESESETEEKAKLKTGESWRWRISNWQIMAASIRQRGAQRRSGSWQPGNGRGGGGETSISVAA
jgi:hypothetical protein